MKTHRARTAPLASETAEPWSPLATELALSIAVSILRTVQRGVATPTLLLEAERPILRLCEHVEVAP